VKRAIAAGLAGLLALATTSAGAVDFTVVSSRIETFKQAAVGERVDGLIWRGGLVMTSDAGDFGGLSGITFTGPDHQLAMVTDTGWFVSGRLIYDAEHRPLEIVAASLTRIENSSGAPLPRAFARDAEALETIWRGDVAVAVRVGFENLTRVADFDLVNGRPQGAAREVAIPQWLTDLRTNESIESICIAPPASPIAGSTLILTEGALDADGNIAGYLLGNRDRGEIALRPAERLSPTACAFLPDGDLLVLERGTGFLSFIMQLRRIPAAEVMPGAVLSGEVILTGSGGDIDNMEGLAVHRGPQGDVRITIVSDDNFNSWERSLLLEFSLLD